MGVVGEIENQINTNSIVETIQSANLIKTKAYMLI